MTIAAMIACHAAACLACVCARREPTPSPRASILPRALPANQPTRECAVLASRKRNGSRRIRSSKQVAPASCLPQPISAQPIRRPNQRCRGPPGQCIALSHCRSVCGETYRFEPPCRACRERCITTLLGHGLLVKLVGPFPCDKKGAHFASFGRRRRLTT